jgi:D-alanyl-D-alanine-carboxypeptidase/D-alanyl-D-alanine-endopeptidase
MKRRLARLVAAVALAGEPALAMTDADLRAAVERRFKGDRTGACIAAAVVDNGANARAYVCADAKSQRSHDDQTAFEIGSVSKPITAALLAELIALGEVTLDDPITKLLPPGTFVPSFEGRQVTIRHIVTHTSGLPRAPVQWGPAANPRNPFAHLTERDLIGALAETKLTRAPGAQWEYSNFAIMVLSYALAKRSGKDFEALLRERLLLPLGMNDTYVARRPPNVRLAQGHLGNRMPWSPWDFPVDMAGVGGVRATLPDMVRLLEGLLGLRESTITPALARTQQQVSSVGSRMGMGWFIGSTAGGRTILWHGGDTGAYSSFVTFDRAAKRAVVLLSDTSFVTTGGLDALGMHLLDPAQPAGAPRLATNPDPKLIDALAGRYRLLPVGLGIELRRKGNTLAIQADGQPEFEMGHDSVGDFYPLRFDALLRPKRKGDGSYTFTWLQGGAFEAERLDKPALVASKWIPNEAQLKDYAGDYLAPGFALRVFSTGAKLFIDAANHGVLEAAAVEEDTFVAESIGAEIGFERDGGKVVGLSLKQNGRVLRGARR